MAIALGIIGIGGLGYLQTEAYSAMDEVTIVAGADIAQEAQELFQREFDRPVYTEYETMLQHHGDELDAVTVVTPHTLHYEQSMACLERGLHVLVEKPMVTDIEQAKELIDAAAERNLILQVGYQRRFDPVFQELHRLLASGRIGSLHTITGYIGQDWIHNNQGTWRVDPALSGGGQLYDTGSHLIDALLWVTEAEPLSVTASVQYADPGVDVNSAFTLRLRRDGRPITASVGISGDGVEVDPEEGYMFFGTEGRLRYTDGVIHVERRDGTSFQTEFEGGSEFTALNRRKLQHFAASIEGTAEPAVPGEVGLTVTAVTEAVYSAAESGTEVSVQSLI
ncbi:Gfo/Idh/MocA family oxidoreductase [Halobellus sp. GM3]|uniref:Gfo/Idh/MocA family oxidoreductase n=1 Tax=Halobellus sp. GM3 TaxID=3458410 RepID=UPI00403D8A2B